MQFAAEDVFAWIYENDKAFAICSDTRPKTKVWWGRLAYRLLPLWSYIGAKNLHEARYYIGCCKYINPLARYEADLEFYREINKRIKEKSFWLKPILYLFSWVYFQAIRYTGDHFYNDYSSPWRWGIHLVHIGIQNKNPFED